MRTWRANLLFVLLLVVTWGIFESGGMRGLVGWISLLTVIPLVGLGVAMAAIVALARPRAARPTFVALALALFAPWPRRAAANATAAHRVVG